MMRLQLLQYILASSAAMISGQYPNGYCNLEKEQLTGAQELQSEGYITAYPTSANERGQFPVVITDKGKEAANAPQAPGVPQTPGFAPQQSAPAAFNPGAIEIERGIAMPDVKPRGFQASEGGTIVDRFKFGEMQIGDTFHLPPSGNPEKPTHRTFSSAVSQANRKLHPRNFVIREVDHTDPKGPGARVWRVQDLTGPRPTRAKRTPEPAPASAPAPQSPGFGAGFGGQPAPGGFAPPAEGFAPPVGFAPPSMGTGGGFAPPAGPQGFAPGGPSFGGQGG